MIVDREIGRGGWVRWAVEDNLWVGPSWDGYRAKRPLLGRLLASSSAQLNSVRVDLIWFILDGRTDGGTGQDTTGQDGGDSACLLSASSLIASAIYLTGRQAGRRLCLWASIRPCLAWVLRPGIALTGRPRFLLHARCKVYITTAREGIPIWPVNADMIFIF
jgi:hypothetical protein